MHPIVPLSAITSVSFCSMFDVGGQRIERRKWIQCFNGLLNVFCNIATIVLQMYVSEKSQSHIEIIDYGGTSLYGYTHMPLTQDCPSPLI